MTGFGDADPEDAWDDGDPRPIKFGVLIRMILSIALELHRADRDHDRMKARIAFGIWQTNRLDATRSPSERPTIEALAATFALLNALEGD